MIRSKNQRRSSARMTSKAVLEAMEGRQLLSTYTVGAGGKQPAQPRVERLG